MLAAKECRTATAVTSACMRSNLQKIRNPVFLKSENQIYDKKIELKRFAKSAFLTCKRLTGT